MLCRIDNQELPTEQPHHQLVSFPSPEAGAKPRNGPSSTSASMAASLTVNRESANELRRAIRERDIEGVLEAMTKRNATFTAKQLERAVGKEIHPEIGAADGKKSSVELERAQFCG